MDRLYKAAAVLEPQATIELNYPDAHTRSGLYGIVGYFGTEETARIFDRSVDEITGPRALHGVTENRFHVSRQLKMDLRDLYLGSFVPA